MIRSLIAFGLAALTGTAALAASKGPREGYMEYGTARKGRALEISVKIQGGYGEGSYGAGFKRSKVARVQVTPRGDIDTMRYDRAGSTANVGYHDSGHGAGFLTAVAAKDRGVVLVDVQAGPFVMGKAPPTRDLLSLDKLRGASAVKGAARRAGLDLGSLKLEVSHASLSAGYKNRDLLTLSFRARLSDAAGKKLSTQLSTTVAGNLARGLAKLSLGSPIEEGLVSRAGWLYPPSLAR